MIKYNCQKPCQKSNQSKWQNCNKTKQINATGKTRLQIKDKKNNRYASDQTNNNKNYAFEKVELVY